MISGYPYSDWYTKYRPHPPPHGSQKEPRCLSFPPDIDECDNDPPPCDTATETCSNLLGTFACKCQEELVKGEDGRCVTRDEREAQRQAKKEKKMKKKKKRMEAEQRGNEGEESADGDGPVQYPWYYMLGPLSGSYVVYKYWRPNLATSVGIVLFISVSAALSSTL